MIERILVEIEQIKRQLDEIRARLWVPGDWTDYSATSTVTGWGAFTTKVIRYKASGKLVFVQFLIYGTSNSANTSFTLPFNQAAGATLGAIVRIRDNGAAYTSGLMELAAGANTANFYSTVNGATWTAAGDKAIEGSFVYVAA